MLARLKRIKSRIITWKMYLMYDLQFDIACNFASSVDRLLRIKPNKAMSL